MEDIIGVAFLSFYESVPDMPDCRRGTLSVFVMSLFFKIVLLSRPSILPRLPLDMKINFILYESKQLFSLNVMSAASNFFKYPRADFACL
jgi:hypothetical protein